MYTYMYIYMLYVENESGILRNRLEYVQQPFWTRKPSPKFSIDFF